jgi:hypothetical protein
MTRAFNYVSVPKNTGIKGVKDNHRAYFFMYPNRGETYVPNINLVNLPSGAYARRFINANVPENFKNINTDARKNYMKQYFKNLGINPAFLYIMARNVYRARQLDQNDKFQEQLVNLRKKGTRESFNREKAKIRSSYIRHEKAIDKWKTLMNIARNLDPTLPNSIRFTNTNLRLPPNKIKALKALVPRYGPQRRDYTTMNLYKKAVFNNGNSLNYFGRNNSIKPPANTNGRSTNKNTRLTNAIKTHWNRMARNRQHVANVGVTVPNKQYNNNKLRRLANMRFRA